MHAYAYLPLQHEHISCHRLDLGLLSPQLTLLFSFSLPFPSPPASPPPVRPGACFLGSSNLIIIALAFGMSIFVLVYASASFSGGGHAGVRG
jgi:hypothetical protein